MKKFFKTIACLTVMAAMTMSATMAQGEQNANASSKKNRIFYSPWRCCANE